MNIKAGKYSMNIVILLIGLSYFIVLINPLGWHMFFHTMPLYLVVVLVLWKEKVNKIYKSQVLILFLFLLYIIISGTFISMQDGTSGKIVRHIYEFFAFAVFTNYKFSEKNTKVLLKIYSVSCLAICIKMLVQRVHLERDTHRFSIINFGKIMDPNYLAALFILPIMLAFFKIVKKRVNTKQVGLLLILFGAVLATGSRGAFVSVILGCGIIYWKESGNAKRIATGIVILIFLFIISLVILPKEIIGRFDYHNFNDDSNSLRINLWTTALKIFASSPIFGRGANSMINLGKAYGARINLMVHNSYLEILADYGLIGFSLWIAPFVSILLKGIKCKNYLVVGILAGTYACAFFISAQHSAFLWQNVLICYILIQFDKNMLVNDKKRRESLSEACI